MTEEHGRINLEDNSDSDALLPTNDSNMSEAQETTEGAKQEDKGGAQPQEGQEGGSWYQKPEGMGNAVGDKVQSTLSPVGNTVGKGLETAGKPLGGIIDPLLGGVMRTGEAFGTQANVGFGNKEGGPAKQADAEGEKMKQSVGGQEQTGDNPLGLNQESS